MYAMYYIYTYSYIFNTVYTVMVSKTESLVVNSATILQELSKSEAPSWWGGSS